MKSAVRILLVCACVAIMTAVQAQNKVDEQRMKRDIEVAENVLGTLLKQQFGKRNFFPFEVKGSYTSGYGVTFHLPMDFGSPMMFTLSGDQDIVWKSRPSADGNFSYSYNINPNPIVAPNPDEEIEVERDKDCVDCEKAKAKRKTKTVQVTKASSDSLSTVFNQKIIDASKDFIADYGDLISQLAPEEKIMITNRNEGRRFWYAGANVPKRKFISLECSRYDINLYKRGTITRAQLITKINVVDSETSDELNPDLELLSSIFNRLYRPDLSVTYYIQESLYYERLKDYGVIYYMQVYSSNESDYKKFSMPTVDLEDIDKATRDKKVAELYPAFEKDIKESIVDYGRTLKSLKDDEMLLFNIKLTKCENCGIPSSLELSVKDSVLKDFSSGKLTKEAAIAKINVKKGPAQ